MTADQILKVLRTERECIARQGDIQKCDRRCGECDLCLPDNEILAVYDFLINGYELLQNEGADEYTIRCKEPLSKEQIERFKEEWGQATFTASFEPISLPDNLKMIIQGDTE